MIKLIIFDYDGVIMDSFPAVYEVYKIICRRLGKKCPESLDEFRKVYGHSSTECYKNLGFSEEEKIKGNIIFKEEISKKEIGAFEGITGVLKELHKNYKLIIVSSTYEEEVKQRLRKVGLFDYFDLVIGKESHIGRFEKTEAIKKVLKEFGIKEDEALLVGDRNVDFIEGTKAGLKNILLVDYGWGYNLKEMPEYKQRVIVKKPFDILKAVQKF